jgi:hypothetical protein
MGWFSSSSSRTVVVFFSLSDYRDNLNDWRVASLLPLQYVGKKTWTFDKLYLVPGIETCSTTNLLNNYTAVI